MAKKSTITVKPGDDILWTGHIQLSGVTSFAGYTLKAEIRAKNPNSGTPNTLLASASISWVDAEEGLFRLTVPRATTAAWASDLDLMLDISVMNTDGRRVRSETVEFKTEAGVTKAI